MNDIIKNGETKVHTEVSPVPFFKRNKKIKTLLIKKVTTNNPIILSAMQGGEITTRSK
tara:strand:+ start:92 stop:265 length:174 start_codon:yes stop_codon:yes gene_type:complete